MSERESRFSALPRLSQSGPWKRGTIRFFWRERTNEVAPYYVRLHRRNPVDHKKLRLRRLEVWW